MTQLCLRPGCSNTVQTIGVCLSCANSDYDAEEEGVQIRNHNGQFETVKSEPEFATPPRAVNSVMW